MNYDDFAIDPTIARKSGLDRLARSPAHYLHYCRTGRSPDTPALAFGRAFHCYILEPAAFDDRFVVPPAFGDLRTKAAREAKAAFMAVAGDKALVSPDDFDRLRFMADAVMAHPTARNLVVAGFAEKEIAWTDKRTGLQCGGRVDYHVPELRVAVDVKTAETASPSGFARGVALHRYHVQDVHYSRGFAAIGEHVDHFLFVVVEKEPPFAVSVCFVDDAAKDRGAELLDRDLDTLRRCIDSGVWPGYGDDIQQVSLPAWAFYD